MSPTTSRSSGRRLSRLPGVLIPGLLAGCASGGEAPPVVDPVGFVDPFVGTGGPGFRVGSETPAATVPFGLVKLGPDTSLHGIILGAYHCSGYYAEDDAIEGFSHLHMIGTGASDYGSVSFMPTTGFDGTWTTPSQWRAPFIKDHEEAHAGYYRVDLDDGIRAELSATTRTGIHRYTFPAEAERTVLVDLAHVLGGANGGGELCFDPDAGTIEGWMTNVGGFTGGLGIPIYFTARVDGGFDTFGTWGDTAPVAGQRCASGLTLGGWIHPLANPVTIQLGLSLTGPDGARKNLEAEHQDSVESAVDAATAAWAEALSRFEISGADETDAVKFYTAVYHLLQMPTIQTDTDHRYRGFDADTHLADGFDFYSDMSLWDTYRTANPAFTLFYPERSRDFAISLLRMAQQGGAFPRWPAASVEGGSMLGAPADIVLADAYLNGVRDWGMDEAWPLLRAQARNEGSYPYNARPDPTLLDLYGYYPSDLIDGSVAWTQELAWADGALAALAVSLGELDDAAYFEQRSYTYRNQWDDETHFFRGRDSAGQFSPDFNDIAWEDPYVEGNAWQYLWMPPLHAAATAELMGGEDAARRRLETFFGKALDEGLVAGPPAWYWHGNEPDIHAAFLFALWGNLDATAYWQRWIEDERYFAAPDGLSGNDDGGTLSAWFLFSTLGLYPLAGTDQYVIGAPRWPEARFRVDDGWFTVRREGGETGWSGAQVRRPHIEAVTLDGATLDQATLRRADLRAGSVLVVKYAD